MSTNLQPQIDQADILITKLQQIRALWDELPSIGDLAAVTNQAARLAGALESANEAIPAEDDLKAATDQAQRLAGALESANEAIPAEDDLKAATDQAERLAGTLESARETYLSGDFPTE
jgi:hypothetical protein